MQKYQFLDENGSFELEKAEGDYGFYFPLASETGLKSAITPNLGGDSKLDQNHFLMEPVSIENLNNNKSGRNFWCRVKGEESYVWSAVGNSAAAELLRFSEEADESKIQAGYMWHKQMRTSKKTGLSAEVTTFIPYNANVEITKVTITNKGSEKITFVPTAVMPIYGRSADNIRDHRHVTAMLHRLVTTEYGVEVTPTLSFDERGHQVNDTMYFVVAMEEDKVAPVGCFPELGQFLGKAGSFMWPEAVVTEGAKMSSMKGTTVDGQETVGALRFADRELSPKESVTYFVYMGACKKGEKSLELIAPYMTKKAVDKAFKDTKEYWLKKCNVKVHTGDKSFDQFMNWVAFQPELRRLFGCSFLPHHDYGKGGRGWRDLWQDCLALLIMNPENVRSMLLGNFAGVRMDGTNATIIGEKQGEFKADRNSITRVWMDHGVWPMVTTLLYLNQTGDYGILEEPVAYFKDRQVMRGTAIDEEWTQGSGWQLDTADREYKGSVLEHLLLQNLTAFFEVGEHGNLRLRDADWNDAIDMAGHRGESVAFTNAYAMNLNALADILANLRDQGKTSVKLLAEMAPLMLMDVRKYDDLKLKKEVLEEYCNSCRHTVSGDRVEVSINMLITDIRAKADFLTKQVRHNEWVTDKKGYSYYNSYYDDNGKALKGMMLTGQVFSIMAGTATKDQVEEITRAADNYLYDEACGGYRLNVDFKELKLDMGRMFGFAYGEKENGAVFSHMCVMYAYALYQAGFAKEGYKALKALYKQSMNFEASRIYPGVPEYFGKDGRGLYHYLTGAASWYLLTVVTKMFGVRGEKGELVVEPKLAAEQFDENNEASISLVYNNEPLTIVISNPGRLEPSEYRVVSSVREENLIKVELG